MMMDPLFDSRNNVLVDESTGLPNEEFGASESWSQYSSKRTARANIGKYKAGDLLFEFSTIPEEQTPHTPSRYEDSIDIFERDSIQPFGTMAPLIADKLRKLPGAGD